MIKFLFKLIRKITPHRHSWSKWITVENRKGAAYWYLTQTRECLSCGYKQIENKMV